MIAALLPMAFVSGLMGPYMSPIPINASMGMLISLAIALVFTPWLSKRLLSHAHAAHHGEGGDSRLQRFFERVMAPFLRGERAKAQRHKLYLGTLVAILLAVSLVVVQWVVMKMLPFDNKSEFQVVVDMPEGAALEETGRVLDELAAAIAVLPEVTDYQVYAGTSAPINFNGLVRQYYLRSGPELGDIQVNLVDKHHRDRKSHEIAVAVRPVLAEIGRRHGASVKIVEVPPGPPVQAPLVAEVYGPFPAAQRELTAAVRKVFDATPDVVDVDDSLESQRPRQVVRHRPAEGGAARREPGGRRAGAGHRPRRPRRDLPARRPRDLPDPGAPRARRARQGRPRRRARAAGALEQRRARAAVGDRRGRGAALGQLDLPQGPAAAALGHRGCGRRTRQPAVRHVRNRRQPQDRPAGRHRARAALLHVRPRTRTASRSSGTASGRSPIETFRDMGLAYSVGLVLIYLLVVAQFRCYAVPLVIMAPIPLTVIGVMPGHALLGAQFTATSMIGMIALAGIIVRNSILLVDFINVEIEPGRNLADAVISAAAVRARPIALTGVAAMIGAFFILDDPIFNGLAVSLIFGILVSTALTLVLIPILYFSYRSRQQRA